MKEVLDSRFLLEYFYFEDSSIRQKANWKMRDLALKGNGIIPTIVIVETIQFICLKKGKVVAEQVYLAINASKLRIESLTPAIAKEAGILKSTYRSVPTGDCIIAATAIKYQARIVSDDPHFDAIKETKRIWL